MCCLEDVRTIPAATLKARASENRRPSTPSPTGPRCARRPTQPHRCCASG